MNIPARYCTGYLGDIGVPPEDLPMDFSAWFEAYLGGRWYTFDARHNTPRIGRILIAHGRATRPTSQSSPRSAPTRWWISTWSLTRSCLKKLSLTHPLAGLPQTEAPTRAKLRQAPAITDRA